MMSSNIGSYDLIGQGYKQGDVAGDGKYIFSLRWSLGVPLRLLFDPPLLRQSQILLMSRALSPPFTTGLLASVL